MQIVDQRKIFSSLKTHAQRMPRNEGENGISCRGHQLLSLFYKILHALKQSFGNRKLESAWPHSLVCSGQSLLLPLILSHSNTPIHSVKVLPQTCSSLDIKLYGFLQGDPSSPSWRKPVLNIHWKDWRWSWNFNPLATWCEEVTHLKTPWCWEGLKAGREGNDRGWDGWVASPTQWTWVWVNSGSWRWTGKPGMLQSLGWQRATELNWTVTAKLKYLWNGK